MSAALIQSTVFRATNVHLPRSKMATRSRYRGRPRSPGTAESRCCQSSATRARSDSVTRSRAAVSRSALTGFKQVVDGARLERRDRVAIVGGDEPDSRAMGAAQLLRHRQTVELGHLDVDEGDIRIRTVDDAESLDPVPRVTDDLHSTRL